MFLWNTNEVHVNILLTPSIVMPTSDFHVLLNLSVQQNWKHNAQKEQQLLYTSTRTEMMPIWTDNEPLCMVSNLFRSNRESFIYARTVKKCRKCDNISLKQNNSSCSSEKVAR